METLAEPIDGVDIVELSHITTWISEEPRFRHLYFLGDLYYVPLPYVHYRVNRYSFKYYKYLLREVYMSPEPLNCDPHEESVVWSAVLPNILPGNQVCAPHMENDDPFEMIASFWASNFNWDGFAILTDHPIWWQLTTRVGLDLSRENIRNVFLRWEDLEIEDILGLDWDYQDHPRCLRFDATPLSERLCKRPTIRNRPCRNYKLSCFHHRCLADTVKEQPCTNLKNSCPHH